MGRTRHCNQKTTLENIKHDRYNKLQCTCKYRFGIPSTKMRSLSKRASSRVLVIWYEETRLQI